MRSTSDEADVRAFFEMHLDVRKRKYGLLAQPYRFFDAIREEFLAPGRGTLLLAEAEGQPIGGVLLLTWKGRLYYKFNASRPGTLPMMPNDLLMWNAVQYGCREGLSELDLGLTDWDQEGLIHYKRKYASSEGEIAFLDKPAASQPAGDQAGRTGKEFGALLGSLTALLTDGSVPDEVSEKAGALLYRYFA